MVDPLSEVLTLLQPGAPFSKVVSGAGSWRIRRSEPGGTFYCVILDGSCRVADQGRDAITLQKGDFFLIPPADSFTMSSWVPPTSEDFDTAPAALLEGEYGLGVQGEPPDVQLLLGHCAFGSADALLLISLLPKLVHVCREKRLAPLVQLVGDESRALRPGRDVVLARLLEVLLIEALRSMTGTEPPPGLVRGLADERLAVAIRAMHENPARPWTVVQLAKEATLARSAFFERFRREMGVPPMQYLLAWRMAMAKNLLLRNDEGVAEVAQRVGYRSASAFSVAFTRHVGVPPTLYAREQMGQYPSHDNNRN